MRVQVEKEEQNFSRKFRVWKFLSSSLANSGRDEKEQLTGGCSTRENKKWQIKVRRKTFSRESSLKFYHVCWSNFERNIHSLFS